MLEYKIFSISFVRSVMLGGRGWGCLLEHIIRFYVCFNPCVSSKYFNSMAFAFVIIQH